MSEELYVSKETITPNQLNDLYDSYDSVVTKSTAGSRTFIGYDDNISIKSDYRKADYDYFRTADAIPTSPQKIIELCMTAYSKVGIVRNVIDLMSDFACQGIRIQHPVKSQEKFLNKWFRKVRGKERSERFINLLYRSANVIVYSMNGTVPTKIVKKWKSSKGNITIQEQVGKRLQIPLQYIFLNPSCVEAIGGDFVSFSTKALYALKLDRLKIAIDSYGIGDPIVQELFKSVKDNIDQGLLTAIERGDKYFALPFDKTSVYFYKKDDWKTWAEPMVYPILGDLILLEKMKLADMSALDGAISNIRLWSVGVLDGPRSILPTKAGLDKVRNILANNIGGGTMDLVFGPELKFTESQTNVHHFLGSEKYKPILDAIYDGLGIPQTLRSGSGTTNTNNTMALKTLIERLQYARDVLVEFWNEQLRIVQTAMGFSTSARIVFENMTLSDEAAEKALLIQLIDRDIVSAESVREKFNMVDEIETKRVRRELVKRREDNTPNKSGPFHNPQFEEEVKKGLVNNGFAAPSEVGINLKDKSPQDDERQVQFTKRQQKLKPKGDNTGRPRNVVETTKRKSKPQNKPRTTAMSLWADKAQDSISEIVTPALLHAYGRKNVRSMTNSEVEFLEDIKLKLLFSLEPYQDISGEIVLSKLADLENNNDNFSLVARTIDNFRFECMSSYKQELTINDLRHIYSEVFTLLKGDNGEI